MQQQRQEGFTLIELSVVLVIIGLVVGGVLVGQDLIRAAEVRSTLSQIEKYGAAANTFLEKYGCLPGDCSNATNFWGTTPECGWNDVGLGSNTCNGNGDGEVSSAQTGAGNSGVRTETVLFWQQLGLAGLIAPVNSITHGNVVPNSPDSALANSCISVAWGFPDEGNGGAVFDQSVNPTVAGNFFRLGNPVVACGPFCANDCIGPSLPASAAQRIDQKIDDGAPTTGTVLSSFFNSGMGYPACNVQSSGVYVYDLTQSSPACGIVLKAPF